LRMKGFSLKWYNWIESFATVVVWVSKSMMTLDTIYKQKKGLCQGYPISPILFNIVVDMLALLIKRAKDDGQLGGVWMMACRFYNMQMITLSLWTTT
jgi:hypothetical protein